MNQPTTLTLTTVVKAKRSTVFAAWTKPEIIKRWFAPGAMTVPNARADVRVGGAYLIEMHGEMGGKMVNPSVAGVYREIVPDQRIVFTWAWVGDPSPETLVTVSFRDVAGGTEVTLVHERFASSEARDKHQHGWQGCLDNLALRIADGAAASRTPS